MTGILIQSAYEQTDKNYEMTNFDSNHDYVESQKKQQQNEERKTQQKKLDDSLDGDNTNRSGEFEIGDDNYEGVGMGYDNIDDYEEAQHQPKTGGGYEVDDAI